MFVVCLFWSVVECVCAWPYPAAPFQWECLAACEISSCYCQGSVSLLMESGRGVGEIKVTRGS